METSGAPNLSEFRDPLESLYQTISASKGLVALAFLASWSPPCKKFISFLPKFATEFPKVTFYTINTDDATDIVAHYSISSIPHMKLFKTQTNKTIEEIASINGLDSQLIEEKLKQFGS